MKQPETLVGLLNALERAWTWAHAEPGRSLDDAPNWGMPWRMWAEDGFPRPSEGLEELREELGEPELRDFARGVIQESLFQQLRWGPKHDDNKSSWDWFWTLGFLAQKGMAAAVAGDFDKARHHAISSAALLANWHRRLSDHGQVREWISCAAIHVDDGMTAFAQQPSETGLVFCGHHHAVCIAQIAANERFRDRNTWRRIQGFLTNTGRFVDRVEAFRIASQAGQLLHAHMGHLSPPQLDSGDYRP